MSKTEPSVTLRRRDDPEGPLVSLEEREEEDVGRRSWFSDAVPSATRRSAFKGGPKIGMG